MYPFIIRAGATLLLAAAIISAGDNGQTTRVKAYQPLVIGQGVIYTNQGVIIGDGELLSGQRLEKFLSEMESQVDALELRVWTDFATPNDTDAEGVRGFIERCHAHNLKVYLNYWQYPGTANPPIEYRSVRFDARGNLVYADWLEDHVFVNHIDKGNNKAVRWLGNRLASRLSDLGEFDGFLVVEDKVSSWEQRDPWPQRVNYQASPTYSQTALKQFQYYLRVHGQPPRLFPVDRANLVKPGLTELVASAPAEPLWAQWYAWRFSLFANYLKEIRAAVQSVRDVPVLYMPWQRVVNELEFTVGEDWPSTLWDVGYGAGVRENAIFGVAARTIAKRQAVDQLIIEYGEDGAVPGWPMELNRQNAWTVKRTVAQQSVGFGSFVQFFNYSNKNYVRLETVAEEMLIARNYKAKSVVLYDVATLYSKSARYNKTIAAYWQRLRSGAFQRLGSDLISEVRTEVGDERQSGSRTFDSKMPASLGAYFQSNGTIIVSAEALNGAPPYYAVTTDWANPRCTDAVRFDHSTLPKGYIKIKSSRLNYSGGFQIVSRGEDGAILWSKIAETPGFCDKFGIQCRRGNWLYQPVSWAKAKPIIERGS